MQRIRRVLLATVMMSFAGYAAAEDKAAGAAATNEKPAAVKTKQANAGSGAKKAPSFPTFPYTYLGKAKMADGSTGVILGKGGKDAVRLTVEKGKNIDKVYRVISVGEKEFTVLYRPMNKRQTLAYQSILPAPAPVAPVADTAKPAAVTASPTAAAPVADAVSDTGSPAAAGSPSNAASAPPQVPNTGGMVMSPPTQMPVDSSIAVTGPASTDIPSGRGSTMVLLPPSKSGSISRATAPTRGSMVMGEAPKTGSMPMVPMGAKPK